MHLMIAFLLHHNKDICKHINNDYNYLANVVRWRDNDTLFSHIVTYVNCSQLSVKDEENVTNSIRNLP